MAGRGRGATLPAWMTNGNLQPLTQPEPSAAAQSAPAFVPPVPKTEKPTPAYNPPTPAPVQQQATVGNSIPPRPQSFQPQFAQPTGMPPPMGNNQMMGYHGGGFPMGGMPNNNFVPPMHMHNPNGFMPPPFVPPAGYGAMAPFAGAPLNPGLAGAGGAPPAPPMPRLPPGAAPAAIDPNNDVTCWAEHESDAGLKYWYNRVTLVSTYDKPFCLKTPEERSIPPCAWKEYTAADDKKYYSNGKESTYVMNAMLLSRTLCVNYLSAC
jgi:hypothetical protein